MTNPKGWFASTERKNQADNLFSQLHELGRQNLTRADYYKQALSKIYNTQQAILQYDKTCDDQWFRMNRSGYSRLHDITMQMFAHVAQQYLTDRMVSPKERQDVQVTFNEQLKFYIGELKDRLPEEHALQTKLGNLIDREQSSNTGWGTGTTELTDLRNAIEQHRDQIPLHLNYLLIPIDLACDDLGPRQQPGFREQ